MNISRINTTVFTDYPHADIGLDNLVEYVRVNAAKQSKSSPLNAMDWHGRSVLDAGCGAGAKVLPWALRGATVYGVDGSANQVRRARELANALDIRNATFTHGFLENFTAVREANGIPQVDLLINTANIHHVHGWREVLPQFSEAIKPGGYLYMTWGDPTLALAGFNLKNQVAYWLGWDAASRLAIGRLLFGWWDRGRNTVGCDWDSFYADLYSAYYIPIPADRMRRLLDRDGFELVESFPPLNVQTLLQNGARSKMERIVAALDRTSCVPRGPLNFLIRLRFFLRPGHCSRLFVCRKKT